MAYDMTIGGARVPAAGSFDVVDPSTGKPFAAAPEASYEQVDDAMHVALAAWSAWRDDPADRRRRLLAAAARLREHADELAALLTREQGKPLVSAAGEVGAAAGAIEYFASLEVPIDLRQDDEAGRVEVHRRPLGVVAAIAAWNFPIAQAVFKAAPALATGNTVVLKPSPYTPLSTLRLGELLADVLPEGVLNVVSGGAAVGAAMTAHRIPRKVTFTGSVASGQQVARSVAGDLKRLTLELGGNDAAIVLDDADPETVAEHLFWCAFANNGQVCTAAKRVYAPDALYEDLVAALATIAKSVKVDAGTAPDVQLGPLNNRQQLERVAELVDDAVAAGGRCAAGGNRIDRPGWFYEPTIVADIDDGARLVDEEQFGPALPVIRYDDVEDALLRANGTMFGLAGSVWGADEERAAAVAARLECGTAWVNTHRGLTQAQPFGGWKSSGIGVENGVEGMLAFTDIQVVQRVRR